MNNKFWIIFDTSTKKAYYQDVHNLICLPEGSIIRYDYRENWLTGEAKKNILSKNHISNKVLLVYAQWNNYKRQDYTPKGTIPKDEMIFIATRIAELQPIVDDGIDYFFDLKLNGYPVQSEQLLKKIIDPLVNNNETPYNKWVAVSDQDSFLKEISKGDSEKNWQSLVDNIGNLPSQFVGDSFWRIRGIFESKKGIKVKPSYSMDYETINNKKTLRKTNNHFDLFEGKSYFTELLSYTPRPLVKSNPSNSSISNNVHLSVEPSAIIEIKSENIIDLRSYTGTTVNFTVIGTEKVVENSCKLALRSNKSIEDWPIGPNVTLIFKTKKNILSLILSVACGIIGAVGLLFATKIWDKSIFWAVLIAIGSITFVVIAYLLYSKKIIFKP